MKFAVYCFQVGSAATVVYQIEKTTRLGWSAKHGDRGSRMKFAIGELRTYAAIAAYVPQVGSAATVVYQTEKTTLNGWSFCLVHHRGLEPRAR